MNIISDAPEYADSFLPLNLNWHTVRKNTLNTTIRELVNALFPDRELFISERATDTDWKWLFVSEFSRSSQFEILKSISLSSRQNKDNILCLAGAGDNFKGYRDRKWVAVPGNIHLAGWLHPGCPIENFHSGFTILTAVSAIQIIDFIPGLKSKAMIRWVNDIVIGRAKVGGVLTLTRSQGEIVTDAFIGIGLNVQTAPAVQADLFVPETASLGSYLDNPEDINLSEILIGLVEQLDLNYKVMLQNGYNQLLNFYRDRCNILGRMVEIYSDPLAGKPQKTHQGIVTKIGRNLELYLDHSKTPVTYGRLILY
jgi:biotin-(acetyl-CoA carboxylase) ligase